MNNLSMSMFLSKEDLKEAKKATLAAEHLHNTLDGPEQECYPLEAYVTNPIHGGKVTCHKCNRFIKEGDEIGYWSFQHRDEFPHAHFHKKCYNEYEHYYGLDKPID